MENRGLKNRIAMSNAIDKDLHAAFIKLSQESKIPQSKLLDEAIQDLLKKYSKKK